VTEQATFQHGGVVYPLATGTGASALHDADPAIYYVLAYFTSVLQTYMGARLAAEAVAAKLNTGQSAITNAVGYVMPYEPKLVSQEQMIGKWPLLAVWRESGKYRWRTVARMETQATWRVAYMLPPMSGGQLERLQPLLNSVPKILLNRIENLFDPAFMSGQRFMKLAGLSEVDMVEDTWGSYAFPQGEIVFPAWLGKLLVIERDQDMPVAGTGGALTGIDVDVQLDPADGKPVIDHFIDLSITTT
jgi:hypothetical protein